MEGWTEDEEKRGWNKNNRRNGRDVRTKPKRSIGGGEGEVEETKERRRMGRRMRKRVQRRREGRRNMQKKKQKK